MQECADRDPRPLEWKDGEGEREGFEKWEDAYRTWTDTHDPSVRRRMRQDMAFVKTFERGWEMRQSEIDALKAENERLRNKAASSQLRFDTGLSAFAERNWKLKKLLAEVGPYEKQNENIRRLIDKELGVEKWITYPVFKDDAPK